MLQPTSSTNSGPQRRLYRSNTDRMLGGVCGGLGAYLDVDPILVRLLFVLLALSGVSVLAYVLLWVLIPTEPQDLSDPGDPVRTGAQEMADRARSLIGEVSETGQSHATSGAPVAASTPEANRKLVLLAGVALVVWGLAALVRALHIPWLWWFDWDVFWPVLLIGAGAALIWRRVRTAS